MWSIKYEKCVKCGTTSLEHVAQGLCRKCYTNKIESKHRNYERFKKGIPATFLTKEKLTELYTDKQLSLSGIGRIAGCSRRTVYFHTQKFGIPLRSEAEARTIAMNRGKIKQSVTRSNGEAKEMTLNKIHFNENFFSKWSNEMAYVLGLIYTDGNITNSSIKMGRLTFAHKEKELLEKFLNLTCEVRINS